MKRIRALIAVIQQKIKAGDALINCRGVHKRRDSRRLDPDNS
jgi:hypothetical protein